MSEPIQPKPTGPPTWLRRVFGALNISWVAALGGAVGMLLIWMITSLIRANLYIEGNFQGALERLKVQVEAQQGTIDDQRRRIDCLEKQVRTGKPYIVLGSTYECIEAPELNPAPGATPGSQP